MKGQKGVYRQNWAGATNEELAADLERWASVREGINTRGSDHLSTSNLSEAAKRLRFCEDAHSTGYNLCRPCIRGEHCLGVEGCPCLTVCNTKREESPIEGFLMWSGIPKESPAPKRGLDLCETCGTRPVYHGSNYCRECGSFPDGR